MRLITALLVSILCMASTSAAQDRLSGHWQGYWLRAGDTLAITMDIRRDASSQAYSATFDSDRLRVTGIPFAEVRVAGCCEVTMILRGDRTTTTFAGRLRGDSLAGTFQEAGSEGTFSFVRAQGTAVSVVEKEITFQNGSATLSGSLLLPQRGDQLPAIVFVHGSGAEGRWASRFLALQLVRQGVAAFIFDKRGVGKSTGDWRTAKIDDLVEDAVAALARLRQEPRLDARRIGIHGHSQGGTLAPMVAVRSGQVAFVIASAAAGTPTDSTEIFSVLNSVYPQATTAEDSAAARNYVSEVVAVAYHGKPRAHLDSLVQALRARSWFFAPPAPEHSYWSFSRDFARYQPLHWWRQVRVPVLLLYGAEDRRVPARESAARITTELLRDATDVDVTTRIFPGADHTFRLTAGAGGWPRTAPDYVPALLEWIKRQ